MSNNGTTKWAKIPAPVSVIVFVIGAAAIVVAAVLLLLRPGLKGDQSKVEANDVIPFAARVDRLDGDVGIARQTGTQTQPYQGWSQATVNAPVSLGDRIYVKDGSKAAIAFSSRNYARLNPRTSLDVVSLTQRHTQLALREGACVFDLGALASDEVFEIGTPNGAVNFTQPGLYQVGIDDGGDTVVSVLSGLAHVAGLAGSGDVNKGQLITMAAAEAAEAVVSELSPTVAGTIVNDYYSYRYPRTYDGRYADYRTYEQDPYYYDETYRRSVSHQYIPDDTEIAGLEDLDDYGDWEDVPSYGHCWHPRGPSADWAPYRDGYWSNNYAVGLTWVSNEHWGWAPYHYGRWAHVNQNWYWVPAEAVRQPVYAPALVAFVPLPRPDEVGWVPLGPGDPYVPRYYDQEYRPRYVGSRSYVDKYVNVTNMVNYNDPTAVTVVSVTQFTRVITPSVVSRPDPAYLASTRPVVDPFAVPVLRQLAPTIEASRPAVPVPVEVQQVLARPVVVRQPPVGPSVAAANIVETLKVQPIPEDKAKRKLQVKSSGEAVVAAQPNGVAAVPPEAKVGQLTDQERQARIAALAERATQGNKGAKREMRQLEEQQRQQAAQQVVAQQQQQTEQRKAEKQAAHAQTQQTEQQRQARAAQEAEQRKAQKQAARQQAQQAEQQRQSQVAQEAEQRKAQKQAARQQAQQAEQQRQSQTAQQPEQRKAQKEAARQQAQQAEQQRQAAQEAEQRKAQKQAARQQAEQQRQAQAAQQAAQQAEQRKAEKRAAQQQQTQQAEPQRQAQATQQAAQQAEQRKAEKRAAQQQQAQQAEQQRQAQESQQQAEERKAQKRAAQEQAQQEAARQQAQEEQRRVQKQAQQQAQEQQQKQKAEKRAQRQSAEQESQPQANPDKAERKAEKAKNKNKNSSP